MLNNQSLMTKKYFTELKDRELKDREKNIREGLSCPRIIWIILKNKK